MSAMAEWTERAACKGKTHLFFPDEKNHRGIEMAIAICKKCPVRPQCKAQAIEAGETDGIWAAMTPIELRAASRILI